MLTESLARFGIDRKSARSRTTSTSCACWYARMALRTRSASCARPSDASMHMAIATGVPRRTTIGQVMVHMVQWARPLVTRCLMCLMRRSSLAVLALCAVSLLVAPVVPLFGQQKPSDTLFTVEKYLDYEQVADPQISPDGAQIVYTRRYVNKMEDRWDAALWIMNADGSRNRFLGKGSNPRWSPDGTRLAFLNDGEPSGTQLFVRYMEAPVSVTQVTRVSEPIADIRWSP